MIQRVLYGLAMGALAIVIMVLGPIWRTLAVAAIMLIANQEMLEALKAFGLSPHAWPTYAFILLMIPLTLLQWTDFYWSTLVLVILALFCQRVFSKNMKTSDCFASLIPVLYPLSLFQFLILAVAFEDLLRYSVLLTGIGAACMSDTLALFGGLAFGKHKLAPEISPKKTIEGAISGLIGGIIAGFIVWKIQFLWNADFPITLYLLSGAIASIAGQIGDLTASSIKREAGIKDFGKLLPGHGGVLDRLDSILFALPLVTIAFTVFGA